MDDLDKFIEKQLQNPEFKKEWDALQNDFELADNIIAKSLNQNQQFNEMDIDKIKIA